MRAARRLLTFALFVLLATVGTAPSRVNLAQLLGGNAAFYEEVEKKQASSRNWEISAFAKRQTPRPPEKVSRVANLPLNLRSPFAASYVLRWRGPPLGARAPPILV